MKTLHNAYFVRETIFGDKSPVGERLVSRYVGEGLVMVDIREMITLPSGKAKSLYRLSILGNEVIATDDEDIFFGTVEAMGYQIGDHEGERVELTERGEQEVALLTSVPYLFHENRG